MVSDYIPCPAEMGSSAHLQHGGPIFPTNNTGRINPEPTEKLSPTNMDVCVCVCVRACVRVGTRRSDLAPNWFLFRACV